MVTHYFTPYKIEPDFYLLFSYSPYLYAHPAQNNFNPILFNYSIHNDVTMISITVNPSEIFNHPTHLVML